MGCEERLRALAAAWAAILGPSAVAIVSDSRIALGIAAAAPLPALLWWARREWRTAVEGLDRHPLSAWSALWLVAALVGSVTAIVRGNQFDQLVGQLLPALAFACGFLACGVILSAHDRARWPVYLGLSGIVLGAPGIVRELEWLAGINDADLVRFLDKSALVCGVALVVSVGLLRRDRLVLTGGLSLFLAFLLVVTFTRSYWLGMGVGLLLLAPAAVGARLGPAADRMRRRPGLASTTAWALAAALVLGSAVMATGLHDHVRDRLDSDEAPLSDYSPTVREFELSSAWDHIRAEPVFGLGAGGEYATLYHVPPDVIAYGESNFIHSAYLYMPLKYGVLGFAAVAGLLIGLVALLAAAWRAAWRRGSLWEVSHAAAFTGLCVASVTAPNLVDPAYAALAGALGRMGWSSDSAMTGSRTRQRGAAARIAVAALLLGAGIAIGLLLNGLGSNASPGAPPTPATPLGRLIAAQSANPGIFVTHAETEAAGKRTPSRILLRWWQMIQFQARPADIAGFFTPEAGVSERKLAQQIKAIRYVFVTTKPQVIDEQRERNRARVFVLLTQGGLPAGRRANGEPVIFELVLTGQGWKLADNALITAKYASELRARPRRR